MLIDSSVAAVIPSFTYTESCGHSSLEPFKACTRRYTYKAIIIRAEAGIAHR
jgi:hypothetical protein